MPCHGAYHALCIVSACGRALDECMGSNRYAPLLCTESSDGGSGAKACARYGRKTKVGRQAPCPFGGEDFFAVLYMRPLHRCRLGALGIAFADNASDMDGMPVHHWLPGDFCRRDDGKRRCRNAKIRNFVLVLSSTALESVSICEMYSRRTRKEMGQYDDSLLPDVREEHCP